MTYTLEHRTLVRHTERRRLHKQGEEAAAHFQGMRLRDPDHRHTTRAYEDVTDTEGHRAITLVSVCVLNQRELHPPPPPPR